MMLNKEKLQEYVDAQHYSEHFVPLQIEDLVEFRGGLKVTETGYECNVEPTVDRYGDEYRVDAGVYRAHFREDVNFPPGMVSCILPSSNALRVGCVVPPRLVTDNDLWTLVKIHKNMVIDEDAVIAILTAYDTTAHRRLVEQIADLQLNPGDTDE